MKSVAIVSNQTLSLINFRGALIRSLVTAGVRVYALTPDYNDELRQEVVKLGANPIDYNFSRSGINPFRDCFDMIRLSIVLRRLRPDVIFCFSVKQVIFGTLAAWLVRVPHRVAMIEGLGYVFTDDGNTLTRKRLLLRAVVSWLYKKSLFRAHRVVFLNKDDLSEFINKGLVDQFKATCLGGIGVDLNEWTASVPRTHPITFLLAARLLHEKGVVQYATAASKIKEQYPGVRFILLGGLDANPGCLREVDVQAWVCNGWLEWPGHVAVKPWLEAASVFVLPSYREGVPRSTQEAMAMGLPVITTNAPGCRETVDEGVNGFLVPVRDVGALIEAMLHFIQNPNLILTMGRESRRLAEERFDVQKVNTKLIKILKVL
jgi:glycosyltransferase involved in cell wall biosynthesis